MCVARNLAADNFNCLQPQYWPTCKTISSWESAWHRVHELRAKFAFPLFPSHYFHARKTIPLSSTLYRIHELNIEAACVGQLYCKLIVFALFPKLIIPFGFLVALNCILDLKLRRSTFLPLKTADLLVCLHCILSPCSVGQS